MPWFRRRKRDDEQAPNAAAAHTVEPEPEVVVGPDPPAEDGAADNESQKPKRRRGSRGGRGRKKTATTTPSANGPKSGARKPAAKKTSPEAKKPEPKKKAEAKKPERKSDRTLSQRQERRRQEGRRRQPQKRARLPEAKRELVVSVDVGERRVAVLEDGKVAEVYLERPERRSIAGNIYVGVVDNVLPGMEAAFVEIGLEKNGFLYVDEIVVPELEGKHHGRKIQDLISKGQTVLVQAVKDPMKTKGARLTTQISLPGRFVVFVPQGEGLGVSRRLDDDERGRLKDILKKLNVRSGGVIVRTAAEGASEEDIERDLVFLQRLWKSIQARAKESKAPALVYQEAELPLRVTRDLFTGDFERAYVDDDRTYKRIVGYLKKTSPHMCERVVRYKDKTPLMQAYGVDDEIRSTLSRRVDLPSGGYLIFDYAEAFTVIDVNTGRFVGGRGRNSNARLEDTITKNNLEAVKEVVRQLRLRDIGGIIVIDFIDMANPRNRTQVEEALRTELERDRTKTYVVEISPLGLVEMTRQNVTDGPREVMTRKCPTCGGDGIVISEHTAAVEVERRLRELAAASRSQAARVEVAAKTATILIGPGASRLAEIEAQTKKRFFLEPKQDVHADHFLVLEEGSVAKLAPQAPVAEGAELRLELVELGRHDVDAGVGKVDGFDVCVGNASALVGKKVKVRIERVLDGVAYASVVETAAAQKKAPLEPLTAEAEAEKPTRKPPARRDAGKADEATVEEPSAAEETVVSEPGEEESVAEPGEAAPEEGEEAPKKRTRRGSRGGRGRKKKTATTTAPGAEGGEPEVETPESEQSESEQSEPEQPEPEQPEPAADGVAERGDAGPAVRIHLPDETLGRKTAAEPGERAEPPEEPQRGEEPERAEEPEVSGEPEAEQSEAEDGVAAAQPKKRTRRGSRGGRKRRKKTTTATSPDGKGPAQAEAEAEAADEDEAGAEAEPVAEAEEAQEPSANGDAAESERDYVPMSEWIDDFDRSRG